MKPTHIPIALILLVIFTGAAEGEVMYSVSFNDPGQSFAPFYPLITNSFLAAGQEWSQFLVGTGTIDTVISFNPSIPTADSANAITVPIGTVSCLSRKYPATICAMAKAAATAFRTSSRKVAS